MPRVCTTCVLIVDDDESLRALLARHFARAGFEVLHAADGIEGLAVLRDMLPKVIVSDLQMPRMSGVEFIGVVRQRFPTIPVILLSGLPPRELPEDMMPDRWIQKDVAMLPDVVRIVDELARKAPDYVDSRQVVSVPVRAKPGFADHTILTCPDCLRTFRAEVAPVEVEGTAACYHCDARVPFRVESSAPQGRKRPQRQAQVLDRSGIHGHRYRGLLVRRPDDHQVVFPNRATRDGHNPGNKDPGSSQR